MKTTLFKIIWIIKAILKYCYKARLFLCFYVFLQISGVEFVNAKQLLNEITVVSDDNYPPYIFRDDNGDLQGIIVDQWTLWQEKTGIKVNLIAMDWNKALLFFNQGKADVIETAFYTKPRDDFWDFTKPYAVVEVPVFFNNELSGINDITSLHGFTIGVKKGDACIEIFKNKGITSLKEYPSYNSVILAAARGEIKVFCVDKPPALYYLYKYNIEHKFRLSFTLYSGEFHRAVSEGNMNLLNIIENGFALISEKEKSEINEKWLGKSINSDITKRNLLIIFLFLSGVLLVLFVFNVILRRTVKAKTLELKKAITEISQKEEKFRTIFNSVSDSILIYNLFTGKIVQQNNSAEEMFGYSESEFNNLKFQDLSINISPYSKDNAKDLIQKTLKEGPQVVEWQLKDKNGELFWTEISMNYNATIFKDAIIMVVRDVSERKKAEEEIREFNVKLENKVTERTNQLQSANKELEAFAYTVSHDLRAPLRAIDGFTRILIEDHSKDLSAEGIKISNVIIKNAKKMSQLIDDLLSFSRISRYEMSKLSVDMQLIVENVCNELITEEIKDRVNVKIGNLPKVTGDRSLLKQVWINLISNSLKFTSKTANPEIVIECEETENEFVYSITDNGSGFDMKYANKLFGVFQRLHANQDFEGTGVGLAIVQRIIQRHNGNIWAEAEIDKGAKFYFSLKKI